jgi:hypothetical protein
MKDVRELAAAHTKAASPVIYYGAVYADGSGFVSTSKDYILEWVADYRSSVGVVFEVKDFLA